MSECIYERSNLEIRSSEQENRVTRETVGVEGFEYEPRLSYRRRDTQLVDKRKITLIDQSRDLLDTMKRHFATFDEYDDCCSNSTDPEKIRSITLKIYRKTLLIFWKITTFANRLKSQLKKHRSNNYNDDNHRADSRTRTYVRKIIVDLFKHVWWNDSREFDASRMDACKDEEYEDIGGLENDERNEREIIRRKIWVGRSIGSYRFVKKLYDKMIILSLSSRETRDKNMANINAKKEKFILAKNRKNVKCIECPVCSNVFAKVFHYLQHVRIHYRLNLYTCRFCEKSFAQHNGLNYHEKICIRRKSSVRREKRVKNSNNYDLITSERNYRSTEADDSTSMADVRLRASRSNRGRSDASRCENRENSRTTSSVSDTWKRTIESSTRVDRTNRAIESVSSIPSNEIILETATRCSTEYPTFSRRSLNEPNYERFGTCRERRVDAPEASDRVQNLPTNSKVLGTRKTRQLTSEKDDLDDATMFEFCNGCEKFFANGTSIRNHVLYNHATMNMDLGLNKHQQERVQFLLWKIKYNRALRKRNLTIR